MPRPFFEKFPPCQPEFHPSLTKTEKNGIVDAVANSFAIVGYLCTYGNLWVRKDEVRYHVVQKSPLDTDKLGALLSHLKTTFTDAYTINGQGIRDRVDTYANPEGCAFDLIIIPRTHHERTV